MLIITEGGFSSALFDEIKKNIAASVKEGRRTFLIVPEQQTVIAEAEMTDFLPHYAPINFDATNFTRLSNTIFRELGGLAAEYCDKTKKLLFMWRALCETAPLLSSELNAKEVSRGVAERYLNAVSEMQSLGISEDDLGEAQARLEGGESLRLRGKLSDLSLVMSTYKRLLSERYRDTADDIAIALEKLTGAPEYLSGCDIYIDGFTSFTEGQYRLISELSARANVTVGLIIPKAMPDAFEYSEISAAKERLISDATRRGVQKKLIKKGKEPIGRSELLSEITENIWRFNYKIDNDYLQNTQNLQIFAAQTPFEMCDFICADIMKRVMCGARFSDFAIVARQAESYAGLLDASLKKNSIPAFVSWVKSIDGYAAVKLIFAAYSVLRNNFGRDDVIAYAKCGFSGISRDLLDEFEMYVEKWQINHSRFTDSAPWGMNPRGYDNRVQSDLSEALSRINETKKSLLSPLLKLKSKAAISKTVADHAKALTEFLLEAELDKALTERSASALAIGDAEKAEEYSRLWDIICDSLDTLVTAVGDAQADISAFLVQLQIVFASSVLGRIPSHIDEVTVGSADMLRLYGKKHIYLIGVNDGEFPASVSDSSFFGKRDREIMGSLGINISSDSEVAGAREFFCFSRALSYAEESITLLYYESDASFKAKKHSDAINKIAAMTDNKIQPVRICELPPEELIWTASAGAEKLGSFKEEKHTALCDALSEVGFGDAVRVGNSSVSNTELSLSCELTEAAYKDKPLSMTQTRLDTFSGCPLSYFCKYNLSLADNAAAEFNAASIGSFIHAILENFFSQLRRDGKGVSELSREERLALTERAAEEYLNSLDDNIKEGGERMKIRLKRLTRAAAPVVDGLCDEFADCEFTPAFFELGISDKNPELPSAPIIHTKDGGEVKIYGTVDRVDTLKIGSDIYVRVVDYKTGHKDFEPKNLEKGENLQMFLYLKAISESKSAGFNKKLGLGVDGEIIPAGVIYVGTSISDVKVTKYDDAAAEDAVKKNQKRQGMLLDDGEIINKMNTNFIPISFKNGEINEASRKLLYSRADWRDIMKTVEGAVADISERIKSGEIKAMPRRERGKASRCEWCEFKPFCRKRKFG